MNRAVLRADVDADAEEHGLQVMGSEYAYHVTAPEVSKGRALEQVCGLIGLEPSDFAAIGDSENDVSTFGCRWRVLRRRQRRRPGAGRSRTRH